MWKRLKAWWRKRKTVTVPIPAPVELKRVGVPPPPPPPPPNRAGSHSYSGRPSPYLYDWTREGNRPAFSHLPPEPPPAAYVPYTHPTSPEDVLVQPSPWPVVAQTPVVQDDPVPSFHGFSGGDSGGAGATDSWAPAADTSTSTTCDSSSFDTSSCDSGSGGDV